MQSFYDEYKAHCLLNWEIVERFAGLTVFSEAYQFLHKTEHIRKLKSRGTFNTCEICNNATSLLKNKRKYNNLFLSYHFLIFYCILYIIRKDFAVITTRNSSAISTIAFESTIE